MTLNPTKEKNTMEQIEWKQNNANVFLCEREIASREREAPVRYRAVYFSIFSDLCSVPIPLFFSFVLFLFLWFSWLWVVLYGGFGDGGLLFLSLIASDFCFLGYGLILIWKWWFWKCSCWVVVLRWWLKFESEDGKWWRFVRWRLKKTKEEAHFFF